MDIASLCRREIVTVDEDAPLRDAVGLMRSHHVGALVVTVDDGQVAGFVSRDDLLEALAGQLGMLAGALHAGLARESAKRRTIAPPGPRLVFPPQGLPAWQA